MKKIKKIIILSMAITMFNITNVKAETIKDNYNKTFKLEDNTTYNQILKTNDKGFVAVGMYYDYAAGNNNGYIIKYDADGQINWSNKFGGSRDDEFLAVTEAKDGGFFAVGYIQSDDVSGLTKRGQKKDAIIVKYDKDGNEVWRNSIAGNADEEFAAVMELPDGNIVAAGNLQSSDVMPSNKKDEAMFYIAFAAKFKSNGTNTIRDRGMYVSGMSARIQALSLGNDGKIYTAGYSGSKDHEFGQMLIINSNIFTTSHGITAGGFDDVDGFFDVAVTKDNFGVAVGVGRSTDTEKYGNYTQHGGEDAIIMKANSNTYSREWVNNYGDENDERFYGVVQTLDGGYLAVGSKSIYNSDGDLEKEYPIMVKFNEDGSIKWDKIYKNYTSNARFDSIILNEDNTYTVLGKIEKYNSETWESEYELINYNFDIYYDVIVEQENGATISVDKNSLLYDEEVNISKIIDPEYKFEGYLINDEFITEDKFNIKKDTLVKAKTDDKYSYKILYQSDDKASEKDLVIRIDGYFNKFDKLFINGKEVDKKYYKVEEGSTIITLSNEYFKNMNVGKNEIKATYTNGKEVTTELLLDESMIKKDEHIENY